MSTAALSRRLAVDVHLPLAAAAASRALPFTVVVIDRADIAEVYGQRLVLVRPDGHVAWRADDLPEDAGVLIDHVRGGGPAP